MLWRWKAPRQTTSLTTLGFQDYSLGVIYAKDVRLITAPSLIGNLAGKPGTDWLENHTSLLPWGMSVKNCEHTGVKFMNQFVHRFDWLGEKWWWRKIKREICHSRWHFFDLYLIVLMCRLGLMWMNVDQCECWSHPPAEALCSKPCKGHEVR